jgi:hypothetical protein
MRDRPCSVVLSPASRRIGLLEDDPWNAAVVRLIARFMFKRVLRKAAFPKGFKAYRQEEEIAQARTDSLDEVTRETSQER